MATTAPTTTTTTNHSSGLPGVADELMTAEVTGPKPPTRNERNEIGMEERPVLTSNKKACCSERVRKGLLILVVIIATIVVSVVVYKLTSSEQRDDFEARYNDYAKQVVKSFQDDMGRVVTALAALSVEITSFAVDTKATFPFVTVSNFEARGRSAIDVSQGLLVCYAPYVTAENRDEFENNYVGNYSTWVSDSRKYTPIFNSNSQSVRQLAYVSNVPGPIWEYSPVDGGIMKDESAGPFVPIWQLSPVPTTTALPLMLLFNQRSDTALLQAINASQSTNGAAATQIVFPRREFVSNLATVGLPVTYVFFPVFTNWTNSREVAGFVSLQLLWETFLNRYVELGANGIVSVLENTCGQAYTSNYSRPGLRILAKVTCTILALTACKLRRRCFWECPPLVDTIYESIRRLEFQNDFVNSKPVVYAVVGCILVISLLVVFLIYDYLEQRRRKEEYKANATALEPNSSPLCQRETPPTQITSSDSSKQHGAGLCSQQDSR